MPIEQIKTLIIGGGQAGLTMSHRLKQHGLAHLVLERGRIAERGAANAAGWLRFNFPTGRCGCRISCFRTPTLTARDIGEMWISSPPMPASSQHRFLRRRGDVAAAPRWRIRLVAETSDARSPLTMSSSLPVPTSAGSPATLRDDIDVFQVHASHT